MNKSICRKCPYTFLLSVYAFNLSSVNSIPKFGRRCRLTSPPKLIIHESKYLPRRVVLLRGLHHVAVPPVSIEGDGFAGGIGPPPAANLQTAGPVIPNAVSILRESNLRKICGGSRPDRGGVPWGIWSGMKRIKSGRRRFLAANSL